MNSVTFTTVMAMSLFGGVFGDFYREKAAVLVTSAEITQVGHGMVEAFYPQALFWHHKVNRIQSNEREGTMGYFSLNEKTPESPRIQIAFTGSSDKANYQIPTGELNTLLKGVLPSNYYAQIENRLGEPLIEVRTTTDLESADVQVPLLEEVLEEKPKGAEVADQKRKKVSKIPIAKKAYTVYIGPRSQITEKYEQFKKGVTGDKAAGNALDASMYRSRALTFEIAPTSPTGDESEQFTPGLSLVKGWFVRRHYMQPFGILVSPVIQGEPTEKTKKVANSPAVVRRESPEFAAPFVSLNKELEVTEFHMNATAFIENIFLPKKMKTADSSNYECLINSLHPDDSACRVEEVGGKSQFTIQVTFDGPDSEKQRAQNTFYIWDKKVQSDYHRVTVLTNLEAVSPSSRTVTPVRERQATVKKENLE